MSIHKVSELMDEAIMEVANNPIVDSKDEDYRKFALESLTCAKNTAIVFLDKQHTFIGYGDIGLLLEPDVTKLTIQRAIFEGMLIGYQYAQQLEKSKSNAKAEA